MGWGRGWTRGGEVKVGERRHCIFILFGEPQVCYFSTMCYPHTICLSVTRQAFVLFWEINCGRISIRSLYTEGSILNIADI